MAGGKLNLFNLGALGVDLVKSPLHLPDGAWTSLQNAEFSHEGGQGGVKKRGSLTRINSSALAGAVQAIANVPLPLLTETLMMVAMNEGETESWKFTEDGASFTDIAAASLQRALGPQTFTADISSAINPGFIFMGQRALSYKQRFYFVGSNYVLWHPLIADPTTATAPVIVVWDGTTQFEIIRIPTNPTATGGSKPIWITDMAAINGFVYLCVFDHGGTAPSHKGRVIALDPISGDLSIVGNYFGDDSGENTNGMPYCLASAFGYLWTGTLGLTGGSPGKIYRIQAGIDESWTLDHTIADSGGYLMSMLAFEGNLYAAATGIVGLAAKVWKRAPDGTWSADLTAGTTGVSYFGGLIAFNDELYVAYFRDGAEAGIWRYNGTSWSEDLDVDSTYSVNDHAPGQPFVFKGNLYWPWFDASSDSATTGFLLKRTTGGTWSKALDQVGMRGCLGKFAPDAVS